MVRSPIVLAALAALLFVTPLVGADAPRYQTSGTYLAGHPGTLKVDACGLNGRPTSGVDSSCVALPGGLAGWPFEMTARDSTGLLVGPQVCFYQDRDFLSCGTSVVPAGANFFSVSSMSGAQVRWTFTVF